MKSVHPLNFINEKKQSYIQEAKFLRGGECG